METAPSPKEGQPEHVDSVNPSPLRWLRGALVALLVIRAPRRREEVAVVEAEVVRA
jgi:hypothetical protein